MTDSLEQVIGELRVGAIDPDEARDRLDALRLLGGQEVSE